MGAAPPPAHAVPAGQGIEPLVASAGQNIPAAQAVQLAALAAE